MEIKELTQRLELPDNQFEGHLILNDRDIVWTLHFVQGRLIWAVDRLHSVRRWNRTINQYFPKFKLNIEADQLSTHQYWQLYLLDQGFNNQQLSLVRAKVMLRALIQECFFELSQCTDLTSEWQPSQLPISRFCRTIALSPWESRMIIHKVKEIQNDWQGAALPNIRPTLSPTLTKPVDPQRLPVPHHYITGKHTLWNIATTLDRSPVELTQSLLPLIQDGTLEFAAIPDLSLEEVQLSPQPLAIASTNSVIVVPQNLIRPAPPKTVSPKPSNPLPSLVTTTQSPKKAFTPEAVLSSDDNNQPLIACIDDSPVLAHSLKKILATGGYRTLIIHEPMQGFSQLIEHMPSLILLDVMLPHTDGYNICRFLRDTPVFKDTPIIILTGRSKPVDRARASMAGATEFLVKPPEAKELLNMIRKYLRTGDQMSG